MLTALPPCLRPIPCAGSAGEIPPPPQSVAVGATCLRTAARHASETTGAGWEGTRSCASILPHVVQLDRLKYCKLTPNER